MKVQKHIICGSHAVWHSFPVTATYASWDNFLILVKEAERLGYDSVWLSDHFISPSGRPYGLETWTVLSALASVTRRIKLGTYVLCNQFRHPSMLAKMASTLDNISKGTLELGIGAGWLKDEHMAFGFHWDRHPARVERLKETITITKNLWTENHVSFNGKHFQLKNATLKSKPFQKPHPPLWIGGNSEAIRAIVAEIGDGWIPVLPTPKQLITGVTDIEERMRNFGRSPEKLRVAYGGSGCALTAENEESLNELAKPLIRSMESPIEKLACLIGTPEQCIRRTGQYREAGAQKIVAGFYDFPSLRSMRLFAKAVIPHFRQQSAGEKAD